MGNRDLVCGKFHLPLGGRTLIMGILNVTPDSFSDGGSFASPRRAVARALHLQHEGADLIDIGGESTRPGARLVSARDEMRRILPVIETLFSKLSIPISVDTSKAPVAEAALNAGASIVNDVTGLRDPRMAGVVSRAGAPVILMHMRGTPRTMRRFTRYRSLVRDVLFELCASIRKARSAGIRRDRILTDPGFGFAKTPEQSFTLLRNLGALRQLGYPVVIGPSRKSFLGAAAGWPPEERLFGTAAAVALGIAAGADVVRVHDVGAMRQVASIADAVARS